MWKGSIRLEFASPLPLQFREQGRTRFCFSADLQLNLHAFRRRAHLGIVVARVRNHFLDDGAIRIVGVAWATNWHAGKKSGSNDEATRSCTRHSSVVDAQQNRP